MLKKRKRVNETLFVIFILIFESCHKNNNSLFKTDSNKSEVDFTLEEGCLKLNDTTCFEAYSFNITNEDKVYGYWGKLNDTIYFINPLFNDKDCIVKFPILITNSDEKKYFEQSSNCEDIPFFSLGYLIEIIDKDDDYYIIKHTAFEMFEEDSSVEPDNCIFKLSLEHGIIEFNYNSFKGSNRVPWCFSNHLSNITND
ncbi:hypothetical protein [Aquimarina sp. MMG016]|uniref:hypothetical protein n=1 Tax=Aquimarina sp. MMG016 TaxID=2822690 RepID=UPI001B3A2F30|nr:hypothetical protein [Aquimarina sp. MMG016]MBQ4819100.1 hypothetical protein [Aquimarina sp. MMG016]